MTVVKSPYANEIRPPLMLYKNKKTIDVAAYYCPYIPPLERSFKQKLFDEIERKVFKQCELLEDSLIVYRCTRVANNVEFYDWEFV